MKILNTRCYKSSAFYLSLAAMILLAVSMIIYSTCYKEVLLEYVNSTVFILGSIGIVLSLGLMIFKITSKYAPIVLWVFALVSFLTFVKAIYMYFPGVFFNGINAESLSLVDPAIYATIVLFLIAPIIANIAIYFANHESNKEKEVNNNENKN